MTFLLAGNCVVEDADVLHQTAAWLKLTCDYYGVPVIFKASYEKANRSSGSSFRGVGMFPALNLLKEVGESYSMKVCTDVHNSRDVSTIAKFVDVIQIPAFLARQTDLLEAAADTDCIVHIKKPQWCKGDDVKYIIDKVKTRNPKTEVWMCERGTTFGYNETVIDFRNLYWMKQAGAHTITLDITHPCQVRLPNQAISSGNTEFASLFAKAGLATGLVNGLFLECHPNPPQAKSDPATSLTFSQVEDIIRCM